MCFRLTIAMLRRLAACGEAKLLKAILSRNYCEAAAYRKITKLQRSLIPVYLVQAQQGRCI